jgi:hypothetical protein
MKQHSKLTQKQEHVAEQTAHAHLAKEFSNSDELLRFDAAQTAVPPEIAERLKKSAAHLPPPSQRTWWKRFFGGSSQ